MDLDIVNEPIHHDDDATATSARTSLVLDRWRKGQKIPPIEVVEEVIEIVEEPEKPQVIEPEPEPIIPQVPEIQEPPPDPIPWDLPVIPLEKRSKFAPTSTRKLNTLWGKLPEDLNVQMMGSQRYIVHPFEVISSMALANAQILHRTPIATPHPQEVASGVPIPDSPFAFSPANDHRPTLSTCHACRISHVVCSGERPCQRCTKTGRECMDVVKKKRGRPTNAEKKSVGSKLSAFPFDSTSGLP